MELRTLSRKDKDFEKYLDGSFSKTHRALPVETLNLNQVYETVTFKIVPVQDLRAKQQALLAAKSWFRLFKIQKFLYVAFPMFLILVKNISDGTVSDPWSGIVTTLSLFLAFITISLRNEYSDHMIGVDRVSPHSGSQVIQSGLMTAAQVKSWSDLFLALSLLASIPVALVNPQIVIWILAALFCALGAQFQTKKSFKFRIGGEILLFLLVGPLLSTGYQIALGGRFDWDALMIGLLWGWLVMFIHELSLLVDIVVYSQAGFQNTVTLLGFDLARRVLAFWWTLFVVFFFFYHLIFGGTYWGWYFSIALILLTPRMVLRFKSVESPVGSDLLGLYRSGKNYFFLAITIWSLENVWYLWSTWAWRN